MLFMFCTLRFAAVVKKGTIVEEGTHNELLAKNGAYATLVQMQQLSMPEGGMRTMRKRVGSQLLMASSQTSLPDLPVAATAVAEVGGERRSTHAPWHVVHEQTSTLVRSTRSRSPDLGNFTPAACVWCTPVNHAWFLLCRRCQ